MILASNSKLLDWITSRVVLLLPESYSRVIPSFAISAALSWAFLASRTLLEDWYSDHAVDISAATLFFVSFNINCALCLSKEDFLIDEMFSPPFMIGQVIVALTVSSSWSLIEELKSLFSDFEILIEADGDNLDLSILSYLIEIS